MPKSKKRSLKRGKKKTMKRGGGDDRRSNYSLDSNFYDMMDEIAVNSDNIPPHPYERDFDKARQAAIQSAVDKRENKILWGGASLGLGVVGVIVVGSLLLSGVIKTH